MSSPGSMRLALAARTAATVIMTAALTLGCGQRPSESECRAVLDHLLALYSSARTEGGPPSERADQAARRAAVAQSLATTFVDQCTAEMSAEFARCAIKARTEAELADCP